MISKKSCRSARLIKSILIMGIFSLTACGGSSSSQTQPNTAPNSPSAANQASLAKLENSGAILKLDRSESIAGPDANENGVRDDIDAYILNNYTDPKQVAAMFQMARAIQMAILAPKTADDAKKVSEVVNKAVDCVSDLNFKASVVSVIEKLTTNTRSRLKAYMEWNELLDGTTSELSMGNTCE